MTTTEETSPTEEELLKAYDAQKRKKKYNAEYMRKYRVEHREEWNKKQREMYAKKKNQGAEKTT